jgi:hypothetical protein
MAERLKVSPKIASETGEHNQSQLSELANHQEGGG